MGFMRLVGSFLKRMPFAFEDAGDVILRLNDRIIEETVWVRNEFPNAVGCDVIEEREHSIDHQDDCKNIMNRHHTTEGEHAEDIWSVDDQTL